MRGRVTGSMASLAKTGKGVSSGIMGYARRKPMKAGAIGLGGVSAAGYVTRGRRGRGVDKAGPGRPTGMYRY